jgi:hypothetical protein
MRQRQRWFVDTDMGQVEAIGTAGGDLMPRESATFRREENARDEMVAEWRRPGMSREEIADHLSAVDAVAGLTLRMSSCLAQLSPSLKGDSGGGG